MTGTWIFWTGRKITPLWNDEITLNGLAQKRTTDFYNLEAKPMQPGKKILKFNDGPFQKSTRWHWSMLKRDI